MSFRCLTSSLMILGVVCVAAALCACNSNSKVQEGTPYVMPNAAPAQAYLDSISRKGEPYRAYGCLTERGYIHYVIIFPSSNETKGILLIYAGPFIPRVKSVDFDQASKKWHLRELPDTGWSFQHLPALRYYKYASNDDMVQAKFEQIMSGHPQFQELKEVHVVSLFSIFGKDPALTAQCP